jgi:hypothetical protein
MTTLAGVMDGLAALFSVTPANVYPYPVESITVPCVVVGYARVDFDATMGRGADTWECPVWWVVGKSGTDAARDALSVAETTGKAALDGLHAFGDVRVTAAEIAEFTVGAVTYLGVRFDCEVIG